MNMSGWDDAELAKFFDAVQSNQKINSANFKERYAVITRINACLKKAGEHFLNVKPVMVGMLFFRAKYAYMAAAGAALSGQSVECFVLIRNCLECAGYALLISDDPTLEEVFINRRCSEMDTKTQKDKFKYRNVIENVKKHDKRLAEIFDQFYDRAIDFGAHPNQHALFSAMTLRDDGNKIHIGQMSLHGDSKIIEHALKSTAQAGLAVLFVFQHIFKEKFELLGIRAEMDLLKQAKL